MGVGYALVNWTRQHQVTFAHLPGSRQKELAGHPVCAAVTTWYLLTHRGDHIAFVSDTYGEWPFPSGSREDLVRYLDVTTQVVEELIAAGILRDDGMEWVDPDEPDTVYVRALTNIWLDDA